MESYFQSMLTISSILWMFLSLLVTGMLSIAIEIYDNPTGHKTGLICAIAFMFGAASVRFPFF